jgi:hypothetical protein
MSEKTISLIVTDKEALNLLQWAMYFNDTNMAKKIINQIDTKPLSEFCTHPITTVRHGNEEVCDFCCETIKVYD